MIRFIIVQNRQGKTRLAKWFTNFEELERKNLKNSVHKLMASRDQRAQSNFVEFQSYKLIYRRYAGLFFCFCVDVQDNELGYLEAIHFFVELLDAVFHNVCELDLVFNFYKVYTIMDEMFMGGELQEMNKATIMQRIDYLEKYDSIQS